MLPVRLVEPLNSHLVRMRGLHERDLAEGFGEVHLPFALARKYPKAGRNWICQYVFPSASRSVDPADGVIRRYHLDEKIERRAVAAAARAAGLAKPESPHVPRHSTARGNVSSVTQRCATNSSCGIIRQFATLG
jgi:hypothetical protein